MSEALFKHGGLRFWSEREIILREQVTQSVSSIVKDTLIDVNPAWRIARCEGPILHPRSEVSSEYDDSDIFVTNHKDFVLRPETTASSYAYARHLNKKLPLCVWQAGISSRRETNDGASAAKLRFNSFWQLEFQCIYSDTTKADYRKALITALVPYLSRLLGDEVKIVDSDRLPSYSESTIDLEFKGKEIASCSIRTDYSENTRVCEIALGLDRVVSLYFD